MNLNQNLLNKKKNTFYKSRHESYKVKQVMGPPMGLPPKRKTNSVSSSVTNWGQSHHSIHNNSTMRSGSTVLSTSETETRIIVALTEGRGDARCEVGMAAIDLSCPALVLCQISDAQNYINTLTKINIFNPTDILVPVTFVECVSNRLVEKIRKQFPDIKVMGVPRKTFNKTNGMDRISQLCLPSINSICVGLQHKYYALAAASALVTYLQNHLCICYVKESINVIYEESEGYAIIDVSTADRLELVSCTKPTQASRYSTLFGVLNYCCTKVGARLLRSTILQPPFLPNLIEETSKCVTELMKHPQMLLSLQTVLQKLASMDQLLTITSMTFGLSECCSIRHLNYLLMLNSLLDLIEPLKEVIDACQQPFFKELKETLQSDNFNCIASQLRKMIHPSAQFARRGAGITQRCFAIKSGINGLLDLVRKTYSERLNDMTEYVKYLGNKYKLPLTLNYNETKGYHIVLKLSNQERRSFKKSDLPSEFMQVYRLSASCTMKTMELINYSTRLEDIMMEIIKISNVMIQETMVDLKKHIGFFYKLCEVIARIDMLQSLAEASKRGNYVKPEFGDFTELVNARHPMLELLIGDKRVANPISISKDFNVQIITGPNGAGKSIYIRQVILLQVMAQVGCYVPAEQAIFRPMNRMFARIYLEDNMEYGASAFMLEIKEIRYMMNMLTENSLFIIDEPCRTTSADEGTALAMAICEKFCNTSVFLYVTTHYVSLTKLADMYLNVKTWQMETISNGEGPRDLILDYKYRLIPGVTQLKHYGVFVVKNIWPLSILEDVYRMLSNLKSNEKKRKYICVDDRVKLKYKLESDLRKLKGRKKLSAAFVNKLLCDYQNELAKLNVHIDVNAFSVSDKNRRSSQQDVGNCFETSSYRNLSNFLREDSDNINKLIPEVTIACSDSNTNTFNFVENNAANEYDINSSFDCPSYSQFENYPEDTGQIQEMDNLNCYSKEKSDNKLQSVSSATVWGAEEFNDEADEFFSVVADLESYKESFFSIDDSELSQANSSNNANDNSGNNNKHFNQHIIPIVKVIEGPAWVSDSSSSNTSQYEEDIVEMLTQPSESINYSPLQSPSGINEPKSDNNSDKSSNKSSNGSANLHTTSTSSLHFITRNQENSKISTAIIDIHLGNNSSNGNIKDNTNDENWESNSRSTVEKSSSNEKGNIRDTNIRSGSVVNLEDISVNRKLDNVTMENLKSNTTTERSSSTDGGKTTTSSAKESDKSVEQLKNTSTTKKINASNSSQQSKGKRLLKKFIPPKKLTKKEILDEFNEQDRKLYETDISDSNFTKYLSQMLKRPSVKQIQQSKHLAFVRRTESGVEVIPAKPEPTKKRFRFKRNLSNGNNVDVSIFSDKYAKSFDEFLNSNERDVKRFKFSAESEENPKREPNKATLFNFNPGTISDYAISGNVQFSFAEQFSQNSPEFHFTTSSLSTTPNGYYKQNKDDINNILNKYLVQEKHGQANTRNEDRPSLFETCSFNGDDLNL